MRSLRRVAVSFLLVVCSVLIFFLILEIALRAIDHPRREARILCLDAIMGSVYCPNIEERLNNMSESTLLVKINSEGMADREYSLIKPDSAIRVWLLPACLSMGVPRGGWFHPPPTAGEPTPMRNYRLESRVRGEPHALFGGRGGLALLDPYQNKSDRVDPEIFDEESVDAFFAEGLEGVLRRADDRLFVNIE